MKAKNLFSPREKFVTCNVDILTDLDLDKLLAFHDTQGSLISFAVTSRKTSRYFLLDQNNRLCGWKNVKNGEEKVVIPHPGLIEKAYSCVVVFEPDIFSLIPFRGKFSLVDVYLALAPEHLILGYDHTGDRFVDVGKPESISIAESLFP